MTQPTLLQPRILLPFSDDSTLFFARRMQALLAALPCSTQLALLGDISALSDRQMAQSLPEGPGLRLDSAVLGDPAALARAAGGVDAIVTARMFVPLQDMLARTPHPARPLVLSFQGGLDFTPERGFAHRKGADAVYIVPQADIARYRAYHATQGLPAQHVDFGHPAFLRPSGVSSRLPPGPPGDLWFFAQAISPLTQAARAHMLALLAAIARRNPARTVWIKLRHLPGENRAHLHVERHDYPGLLARLRDAPANLRLTSCSMAEAIAQALSGGGTGLTCTSTAAADLIQAGVPVQIYLDYVENYLDPLTAPMRRLFGGSNLIATLPEVLNRTVRAPDPDWLAGMFCPPDLGARLLAVIAANRR